MTAFDLSNYAPAPALLQGRVILVTGAGAGIGCAVAAGLARFAARPILLDRSIPMLERASDAIERISGEAPALYPLDLAGATYTDYETLAATVEKNFGRLDGLLHNAADPGELSPIAHYDPRLWARVIQVNLHAAFMLTQVSIELLRRAEDASVLFTSDTVGRRAKAYWGAYGVSKFAVEGFMQTLAQEWSANPSMRVNSFDPGPVRTALRRLAYPAEHARRLPEPETLLPAYLYLLGPDSRGVTGQAFAVSGDGLLKAISN